MTDDDEIRGAARRFNFAFDTALTAATVWAVMAWFVMPVLGVIALFCFFTNLRPRNTMGAGVLIQPSFAGLAERRTRRSESRWAKPPG